MLENEIEYLDKISDKFSPNDDIYFLINDVKAILYSKTGLYDAELVCHDILHRLEHVVPSTKVFSEVEIRDPVNIPLYITMMHLKFAKETLLRIVYSHEILANTNTFLQFMLKNIYYHAQFLHVSLGENKYALEASFFTSSVHGDTLLFVLRHLMEKYSIPLSDVLKHSSYDVLNSVFSYTYLSASPSNQITFIDYVLQKRNEDIKLLVLPVLSGAFSSSVRRSILLNDYFLTCRIGKSSVCLTRNQIFAIRNFFNRNTLSTGFLINKVIEDFHTKCSDTDSTKLFSDMSLFSLISINPYLDDHDVQSTRKAVLNTHDKEAGKELSSMPSMFSRGNSHLRRDIPQRKSI